MCTCTCACVRARESEKGRATAGRASYLCVETVQHREHTEELAQGLGHVLLYHLPADAQANEGHEAEGLQTHCRAGLYSTGETE